jgi:hypothetical protein
MIKVPLEKKWVVVCKKQEMYSETETKSTAGAHGEIVEEGKMGNAVQRHHRATSQFLRRSCPVEGSETSVYHPEYILGNIDIDKWEMGPIFFLANADAARRQSAGMAQPRRRASKRA